MNSAFNIEVQVQKEKKGNIRDQPKQQPFDRVIHEQ